MFVGGIIILVTILQFQASTGLSSEVAIRFSDEDKVIKEIEADLDVLEKDHIAIRQLLEETEQNVAEQLKLHRLEMKQLLAYFREQLLPPPMKDCAIACRTLHEKCKDLVDRNNSGPAPEGQTKVYATCEHAIKETGKSGVYLITILLARKEVYCLLNENSTIDGANRSPWLIMQRRQLGKYINFHKDFVAFRAGFGHWDSDYFLGLFWVYRSTKQVQVRYELWIQLEDFDGEKRYAKYSNFKVGSRAEGFYLKSLGQYVGDAGDSLSGHLNANFSTFDEDVDGTDVNCAVVHHGAWWYSTTASGSKCADSNLNGKYHRGGLTPAGAPEYQGIFWLTWRGASYSYKYVHMAIRPVAL